MYSMLGIIALLVGMLLSQYRTLAKWKIAASRCVINSERQNEIIWRLIK
jgi:hypothetical protein